MVVAESDGALAGFAYCFRSGLHPERYWATTRVCDAYRRQGVGTALVRELGKVRDEDRPFYVKLRADNPALPWIRSLGGVPFQECPPMTLDLTDPPMLQWIERLPSGQVVPGTALADDDLVRAFSSMYEWVHEDWAPVTSRDDVERVYGGHVRRELDRELSHFAVDGRILAGVFVFRTPAGEALDAVAETMWRDVPDGAAALARCVRETARQAAARGWRELSFDGHRDDPHLFPLLATAPKLGGDTLYYLEFEPPRD